MKNNCMKNYVRSENKTEINKITNPCDMLIPQYEFDDIYSFDEAIELLNLHNNYEMAINAVDSISYGIENDLLSVFLFDIKLANDSNFTIRCHRDTWKTSLISNRNYFEKIEIYEQCARVRDLLIKLEDKNINDKI